MVSYFVQKEIVDLLDKGNKSINSLLLQIIKKASQSRTAMQICYSYKYRPEKKYSGMPSFYSYVLCFNALI